MAASAFTAAVTAASVWAARPRIAARSTSLFLTAIPRAMQRFFIAAIRLYSASGMVKLSRIILAFLGFAVFTAGFSAGFLVGFAVTLLAADLVVERGAAPVLVAVFAVILAAGCAVPLFACFCTAARFPVADMLPAWAAASFLFVESVFARVAMAVSPCYINGLYCLFSLMVCRALGKPRLDHANGPGMTLRLAAWPADFTFVAAISVER